MLKKALGSFAVMGLVTLAHGAQITQTINIPLQTLEINGTEGQGEFDYWQDVAPGGAVLTGVKLRISVSEVLAMLTVTNTAANPQNFQYFTFTNLTPNGTAPLADRTALNAAWAANGGVYGDIDLYDTGFLNYIAGETKTFAPPSVNASNDSGLINAANINAYNTTGQFTLGFSTLTAQSFSGAGGNSTNSQLTDGSGQIQVIYEYDIPGGVPEPGTYAMIGGGLALLGMLRRRRA
jgi:hypothetical protein